MDYIIYLQYNIKYNRSYIINRCYILTFMKKREIKLFPFLAIS